MMRKILNSEELRDVITEFRKSNRDNKIALCHGVFDLVHPGHLEHLKQAKKLGNILVVSITADTFVNKGPNRPYFKQDIRASFLAALEIVNYVFVVNSASALDAINVVKPDFYVKGPDYRNLNDDITGKIEVEKTAVESLGGEMVFTDGFTSSSTRLINSALAPKDDEVGIWVRKFKKEYSTAEVHSWIDKLANVEVAILGESIIDAYTECKPLAKSSKDPILAFQRLETHQFPGGVLAIADSCSNWSLKTSVYSVCGKDFKDHLNQLNYSFPYEHNFLEIADRETIVKHRFVDVNSGYRVFEYYDYNPEEIDITVQSNLIDKLESKLNLRSLLILADYGHGFFGEFMIRELCRSGAYLCVNTQANAGNRGFNTFSKYFRIDFLCLNGGELELELRSKNLDYGEIVPKIMKEKGCKYSVVTLGGKGLLTFDNSGEASWIPALASKVVDKVGAGDSVLSMASMLAFLGAPKEIIGLLSSVVAAFEVSQLGHKDSISIVNIKRFVNGLLD